MCEKTEDKERKVRPSWAMMFIEGADPGAEMRKGVNSLFMMIVTEE